MEPRPRRLAPAAGEFIESGSTEKKGTSGQRAHESARNAGDPRPLKKDRKMIGQTHTDCVHWCNADCKGEAESETEPIDGIGKDADAEVRDRQNDDERNEE